MTSLLVKVMAMICLEENVKKYFVRRSCSSYIQKHDLSKYNTTHPVRVINGKPSSAKKSTSDSNQHTHSKNSTSKTAQPHKKSA